MMLMMRRRRKAMSENGTGVISDKAHLVPVGRLAPAFLQRMRNERLTDEHTGGCCGCDKPLRVAHEIAGAIIVLTPSSGPEAAAAVYFLCRECAPERGDICRRLGFEPVETSPDEHAWWRDGVMVEMAIAIACGVDPAAVVPDIPRLQ